MFENIEIQEGVYSYQAILDTICKNLPLGYTGGLGNLIIFPYPFVNGTVVDELTGEPLEYATIRIRGTNKGTTTDQTGNFLVRASYNDTLIVSYVGHVTQTIPLYITYPFIIQVGIRLKAQQLFLQQLTVNTGYYKVQNEELPGNISTTTSEQISRNPVSNPLQALQARMPGVFIEQLSGIPGSGFRVRIRGRNSLRDDGNNPLYIVDGVPFPDQSISSPAVGGGIVPFSSPLSMIPLSTIDRIDVLKDADATAIYGSRGANGIILITTKQASEQPTYVQGNFHFGFSQVSKHMDLLDNKQWVEMRKEAFQNDNVTPSIANAPDILLWDTTHNTNWQKELLGGTAPIATADITVSSGEGLTKFLATISMCKEGTVFPGSFFYQRAGGLLNITHHSKNGKFKSIVTINYSKDNSKLPIIDLSRQALSLSPVAPPMVVDNELNWGNGWVNPLAVIRKTYETQTTNSNTAATLQYDLYHGITLKTRIGYVSLGRDEMALNTVNSYSPQEISEGVTGSNWSAHHVIDTWITEPQIEYERIIANGKLELLMGLTFNQTNERGLTTFGYGYTEDALIRNIGSAPFQESFDPIASIYKYSAGFGRLNYTWRKKYILNLTGRRDGSTRFGPGNQFANFGAIGAAWILSQEPFIDHLPVVSFAKLRATFGTTGSDQIGDYGFYQTYSTGAFAYQGSTFVPNRLANPSYSWEESNKFEGGLVLGIFDNRIQVDLSWYRNQTSSQLTGLNLPGTTGFQTMQYNMPIAVRNTGIELLLSTVQIDRSDLKWKTSLNLTYPRNKLVRYDNLAGSNDAKKYAIGFPIDLIKRQATSIDPETGGFLLSDEILRPRGVRYYGGIDNVIRFRNFELSVLLQFVKQIKNSYSYYLPAPGLRDSNQPVDVMKRWQSEGDIDVGHKFTQNPLTVLAYYDGVNEGDVAYTDASYMRLKNLSLSYSIQSKLLQKIAIANVRLSIQAQNVFTITDYFSDPESADPSVLPPLRTVTAGMSITF
jgi:TonB-linked SusC/RagA family outer membrane protein